MSHDKEVILDSQAGPSTIYRSFYDPQKSDVLFQDILSEVNLEQKSIFLFGKEINQPRLISFQGERDYKYSNQTLSKKEWTPTVFKIKQDIESFLKLNFNTALINYYRDGKDSMGAHSDDEKELGENPNIASVSLGGTRSFVFIHKKNKKRVKTQLNSGDLLIMRGLTQKFWKHELPKTKSDDCTSRLNLTFREVF